MPQAITFDAAVSFVVASAAEHPATAHREPPICPERAKVIAGLLLGHEGGTRDVIDMRWRILNATGAYPSLHVSTDPEFRPDNTLFNDLRQTGLPEPVQLAS